jgi:hypothetical protein
MGRDSSYQNVWLPSVNSNHGSRSNEINRIVSGSQRAIGGLEPVAALGHRAATFEQPHPCWFRMPAAFLPSGMNTSRELRGATAVVVAAD